VAIKTIQKTQCDVLIIGGGGAGLRASIAASEEGADVLMVSKTRIGHATNTYISKAIIASSGWGNKNDNSDTHGLDTIQGGRYLNNPDSVAGFVNKIPSEMALMQKWGMELITDEANKPAVTKIPGHSFARHLVGKNWKGSDLILPLMKKAKSAGVRFKERFFVSSLIVSNGRVCGATCISADGRFLFVSAKTIVLATGGFGHVYQNTNNAPGITGDGQALACQAGALLQDMEFVQFYPTALGKRGSRILLYERLLAQEGVILKNSRKEDILKKNGYTMPYDINRDQLAQMIMKETLEDPDQNSHVYMDLSNLTSEAAKELAALLPTKWFKGTRIFKVSPTTHFCMGGVKVNPQGETSCKGLFAAGEVTAGAHGANRLGGNALAEVIAMGSVVGKSAAQISMDLDRNKNVDTAVKQERARLEAMFNNKGQTPRQLIEETKQTMWINAGIIRNKRSLETALEIVLNPKNRSAAVKTCKDLIRFLEFENMRLIGEMICRSALERAESRGSHFRDDYPRENEDNWRVNIQIRQSRSDLALEHIPVARST